MKHSQLALVLVTAASLLAAGCAVREHGSREGVAVRGEVDVPAPPPPVEVDQFSPAPGPGYVWIAGAWNWNGNWIWERAHWAYPPRPGAVWEAHRYAEKDGRHVFVRGGWR
jgi:hypothetical protein